MNLFHIAGIGIFAPLIGFVIAGFTGMAGGKRYFWANGARTDRFAQAVTCSLMAVCALACTYLFFKADFDGGHTVNLLMPWIESASFTAGWGIRVDTLSTLMMMVVSFISFLVHVYSVGYMHHDHSIPRFMAYLSLFTFAMLTLVAAPNLLQLFFGWEGVGVVSYLLIGFWHEKPSANAAAIKAFLMNRVGDVGLVLGLCAIFALFHTFDYDVLFSRLVDAGADPLSRPIIFFAGMGIDAFNLTGILLFIGAMGKSAQIGLHTWLADAMEGPTPVSALIHAATMVTAGVFLMVRMAPLYELAPLARHIICFTGALTAFFAAVVALSQNDIKRIIAYSTCSQLGYMFMAVGVSAYGAALFHLVTHAFFKALLFLGAGAVIHAMSDEQDIRRMGGIWKLTPITYIMMWMGSLALAGIPFFAGYYSKDAILEAAGRVASSQGQSVATFAFYIGLAVISLTAFYSWRLLLLTFHGPAHANERVMAHVHEVSASMKLPLYILAAGALFSGYGAHDFFMNIHFSLGLLQGNAFVATMPVLALPEPGISISCVATLLALTGILAAYLCYYARPQWPEEFTSRFKKLYAFSLNKGYVDELYNRLFTEKAFAAGKLLWKKGDSQTIDGFGPDGLAKLCRKAANLASQVQTGYVNHYAFIMLAGVVLLTLYIIFL